MAGKQAIIERWSRYFASPEPPFSWGPDRVAINAADRSPRPPDRCTTRRAVTSATSTPYGCASLTERGKFSSTVPAPPPPSSPRMPRRWKKAISPPTTARRCTTRKRATDGHRHRPAQLHRLRRLQAARRHRHRHHLRHARPRALVAAQVARLRHDPAGCERSGDRPRPLQSRLLRPVGFSYLGLMVAMYTIDHPEHVARLVQIGPVPRKAGTQYPKRLTNGMGDVFDSPRTRRSGAR